jgi:hypothetical protein
MIPQDLLGDWRAWSGRVARLAACALDRVRSPEWSDAIERAERWADGGRPARNSRGSRLPCLECMDGWAFLEAGRTFPFRRGWQALADLLGPLELPSLPSGWQQWKRGTIPALAEEIYQRRDWALCPILADALEDCDVTNEEILGHLRSSMPHYRGSWSIDLLTGRMLEPRRQRLRQLPAVNRAVKYELLCVVDGDRGASFHSLYPSRIDLLPALLQEDWPVLATQHVPHIAYSDWGEMYWQDDYILSLRYPAFVLEREVAA